MTEYPHTVNVDVYPMEGYEIGEKEAILKKDTSKSQRVIRLAKKFEIEGIRRSVEAILVVHKHNFPHILIFADTEKNYFLPGGRLRKDEDEVEGLKRKLQTKLHPDLLQHDQIEWEVGEQIAVWWRPNFEETVFPYIPPHITKPKEVITQYLVQLPESCSLAVPENYQLLAIPFFEFYDNSYRWGSRLEALPRNLSRIKFNLQGEDS